MSLWEESQKALPRNSDYWTLVTVLMKKKHFHIRLPSLESVLHFAKMAGSKNIYVKVGKPNRMLLLL